MKKAYSALHVKAISEDGEFVHIEGIASSPKTDRDGDIVLPMGAQFQTPMPLLLQHKHDQPVGQVYFAAPNSKGIPFKAKLPIINEVGKLKERVDEAIHSLKHKLLGFVSIGFSPIEGEFKRLESGGYEFKKWNWHELSIVTIPAQPDAVISMVKSISEDEDPEQLSLAAVTMLKSYDGETTAASGKKDFVVARLNPTAGASASNKKSFDKPKPLEGRDMKNIQDQIKSFQDSRAEKAARLSAIMDESSEKGMTLDAAQSEEYDTLAGEIDAIDKHLVRLFVQEKANMNTAKPPVPQGSGAEQNSGFHSVAKNTQKLEPGIAFARAAKCLAIGHLEHRDSVQIAKSLYGDQPGIIAATERLVTKAAVAPATTTQTTWAAPLVGADTAAYADFLEWLRPTTVIGKFGNGGVPSLRRVPFRTPLIGQTSGGDGYWVGEGQAKPLTKFDFSRTTLEPLKLANIAVATMEVIRDSSPSADGIIRDQLAAALRERLDRDFIAPTKAAVAGVSPASILNGVTPIVSSGNDADAIRADMRAAFAQFIAANNAPTNGVWVMSSVTALSLSMMVNPLGQPEFSGITMNGGSFFGLPVITSEFVPSDSGGGIVALVNASDIYYADEGGLDVSMSTEASLQMDSAPDNPTTATTVLVSLWQRNLVGFRAEMAVNFARRRTSAVSWIDNVNWGE